MLLLNACLIIEWVALSHKIKSAVHINGNKTASVANICPQIITPLIGPKWSAPKPNKTSSALYRNNWKLKLSHNLRFNKVRKIFNEKFRFY